MVGDYQERKRQKENRLTELKMRYKRTCLFEMIVAIRRAASGGEMVVALK